MIGIKIIGYILILITLPGTLELALLTLGVFLPSRKLTNTHEPVKSLKVVAIIPAHNEERNISKTLKSLQACPDAFSTVVVADNCTDRTAQIAAALGARVFERNDSGRKGKNFALQYAFKQLLNEDFDIFLIIDADTIVGPNLIEEITRLFKRGFSAVQVKYALLRPYQSFQHRLLNIAFSAFNFLRPRGRQNWGFSAGLLGNGFALSRELLVSVPFQEKSIVEDVAYHIRIVKAKYKVIFSDNTSVYSQIPSSDGFAIQRSRWEGGRMSLLFQQCGPLIYAICKGNFLLIEPLLDLLLLPLGLHTLLLLILLLFPMISAKIFAGVGLAVAIWHTLTAIALNRGDWRDYLSLLYAPIYIIQKLSIIGKILKGAYYGKWERTPRNH